MLSKICKINCKNRQNLASTILNAQLQNSISRSVLNESQQSGSQIAVGYGLSNIEDILKIKQNTFVLLLIRQRYFFGTLDMYYYEISIDGLHMT